MTRSNFQVAFLLFVVGALLATTVPETARCQSAALPTEDLVQQADVIVVGRVTAMTSSWNSDRSRIFTRVTLSVSQSIKGDASENSVTVTVPGGEVDGIGELYSHTARFKEDEDVVVFAAKNSKGELNIVGGDEGKTTIRKEDETRRNLVSDNETLEMYTAKLKSIVRAQRE